MPEAPNKLQQQDVLKARVEAKASPPPQERQLGPAEQRVQAILNKGRVRRLPRAILREIARLRTERETQPQPDDLSASDSDKLKPQTSTRRQIGKFALGAGAGVVIGHTAAVEKEFAEHNYLQYDGFRAQPLYERHDKGPTKELTNETDGLFVEYNKEEYTSTVTVTNEGEVIQTERERRTQYTTDPDTLLQNLNHSRFGDSPGRERMLEQAKAFKIPIAIGDIAPLDGIKREELFATDTEADKFWSGITLAVLSQVPEATRRILLKMDKNEDAKLSRRALLKAGAVTAATSIAGGLAGGWIATDARYFSRLLLDRAGANGTDAISRLLIRLHGVTTHAHPEDPMVFLRNAAMALKIRNFAHELQKNGDNPLIAFNVGRAHSGIEDFLGLPDDVLRTIVVYSNKEYRDQAIASYGEHIAATRILKPKSDGSFEDKLVYDTRLLDQLEMK